MDSQLKKGLLEGAILAVIKDDESYGYKIMSDLPDFIEMSESTLYPILKRLEVNNCLKTTVKLYNGRTRKYYALTELGHKRLEGIKSDLKEMNIIIEFILAKSEELK